MVIGGVVVSMSVVVVVMPMVMSLRSASLSAQLVHVVTLFTIIRGQLACCGSFARPPIRRRGMHARSPLDGGADVRAADALIPRLGIHHDFLLSFSAVVLSASLGLCCTSIHTIITTDMSSIAIAPIAIAIDRVPSLTIAVAPRALGP